MSVPSKPSRSKTPRAKTQSAKPAKPRRRRAEKQSEASIPLADLAARKKARAAKIEINSELLAHAHVSKAWPFEEARKVLSRLKRIPKPTGAIIFETGYGPSGLPHIGTFGEVARTTMVRHAFRVLTEDKIPTRLICFSDDMDGLRKVPGNIPNKEMVAEHLGKPLTQIPDPVRRSSELRPPQQCAAQGLSRHVRLRLRVPLGDRMLHHRALRQDAAQGAPALRRDPRRDPADARAGAARHLQPLPADLFRHRPGAAGADHRSRRRHPARSSTRSRRPGSSRRSR